MPHDACCPPPAARHAAAGYRRVLAVALALNAAMFLVEIAAGLAAQSVALLADAIDFLGDAANYGLSLMVLGLAPAWGSRLALLKGLSMAAFGLWVIAEAATHALNGTLPQPAAMGATGLLALAVNLGVAWLLYRYRQGDANMRAVWLCTRNDALGNLAVLLAATGVAANASGWPDYAVAAAMAALALSSACTVTRQALAELAGKPSAAAHRHG
ncbi:MAG: cation transporter [Alphaproteobacteria bacterium]|nr:cation transporter [Alphaproteobacteria bacterium]